jgi:MraZ protein
VAEPPAEAAITPLGIPVFQGENAITIDDKGRLAVPTVYRDPIASDCANQLVITYSPFDAGCLYIYPRSVWESVRDQVNKLPRTKASSRNLQLKLVGAAHFVELDGNGRISIPPSHRNNAALEKRAVLVGMGDKFELWSEHAHQAQVRQVLTDADLTEELLDLQL